MSEPEAPWADSAAPASVAAPAKLTRSLRVTGRRPDGYHVLVAEMVSLDWGDLVHVAPGEGFELANELPPGWSGADIPQGADNLVQRALLMAGRSARVRLVKRIPPGAGLGGGSSDAAAVLRWAGVTPSDEGLRIAAALGSDVAFCLLGGRAEVGGAGEVLRPMPPIDMDVTLLLVPFAVSTPDVYRVWDELGGPRAAQGDNDLEAAALALEPRLAAWRTAFAEATGLEPKLAGSGSTWFVEEGRPEMAGPFPPPGGSGTPGFVVVTRTGRP
jgi:4-diphosphocytidyl-2-C-methyl-D-erythritol kinase